MIPASESAVFGSNLIGFFVSKKAKSSSKYLEVFKASELKQVGSWGKTVYTFAPGPCILPYAVMKKAADELVDYRGTGQSMMEISHRKPEFLNVDTMTKEEIRNFLKVPDTHTIMLN